MKIKPYILLTTLLLIILSCKTDDDQVTVDSSASLIFQSGFESSAMGFPEDAHLDISGSDASHSEFSDWNAFDAHPNIGDFTFQYEGGLPSERYARIIDDPTTTNNRVLSFWLKTPNVIENGQRLKGRVQANINNNTDLNEILIRGRCFLHSDFNTLTEAPMTFGWLSIFEFWNNPTWQDYEFPFRITVNIKKLDESVGAPLRLGVHGQKFVSDSFTNVWSKDNTSFILPTNTWLTYEVYLKEGNNSSGRFYMSITANGNKTVIFDINNFTHHPDDSNPDGLSHFNPMKLYTSAGLIEFMESRNKVLQIFWDDFELWKGAKPNE